MDAATAALLRAERPREGLAVLTLNRPKASNALSLALRRALVAALDELDRSATVPVVILTGAGKTFCAGLDLKELSTNTGALVGTDDANPIAAIRRFSGVVIGAVNGPAVTGGFELALACDLLIMSDQASFADTHIRVGAMPGWHLSQRLSRIIGPYRAKYLSLTGSYLGAAAAESWGLVSEVVPGERLMPRAEEIAAALLEMPPTAVRNYKSIIDDGYALSFAEGVKLEAERAATHNGAVRPDDIAARRIAVQQHGRERS